MGRFRDLFSHQDESDKEASASIKQADQRARIGRSRLASDNGSVSRDTSNDSQRDSGVSRVSSRTSSRAPSPSLTPQVSIDGRKTKEEKVKSRFMITGATHEHHLKGCRRKEKLGRMFKELMSGRGRTSEEQQAEELDSEATNALSFEIEPNPSRPPSLLSALVRQLQEGGETDPASVLKRVMERSQLPGNTFTERFGICSEVVGRGSFGIVKLAHRYDASTGKPRKLLYAVKQFTRNNKESEADYMRRLTSEFCLASSLHHPNIIESLDLTKDTDGNLCGVMEFCAGGDLYSLIVAVGKLELPEADCFFKQMLRGIRYMHEMGVAHRDLKPENILLTSRGAVKITDFGSAECFRMAWEREVHLSDTVCGSGPYIAPEVFGEAPYDPRQADSWSLGVIYLAMCSGRHLWGAAKMDDPFYEQYIKDRKNESGYDIIERIEPARRRNVIYSILDPRPSRRLSPKQVLNSEWGREIKVCSAGEGHREYKDISRNPSRSGNSSDQDDIPALNSKMGSLLGSKRNSEADLALGNGLLSVSRRSSVQTPQKSVSRDSSRNVSRDVSPRNIAPQESPLPKMAPVTSPVP